jgi:hypothetical protein
MRYLICLGASQQQQAWRPTATATATKTRNQNTHTVPRFADMPRGLRYDPSIVLFSTLHCLNVDPTP